jgi:hypothetical protein
MIRNENNTVAHFAKVYVYPNRPTTVVVLASEIAGLRAFNAKRNRAVEIIHPAACDCAEEN